jgi:hypothetical protein
MPQWLQRLIDFWRRVVKTIIGEPPPPTSPTHDVLPGASQGVVKPIIGAPPPPTLTTQPGTEPAVAVIPPKYRKTNSLMTFQERKFYRLVLKELSSEYAIFSKVRLGDVVWLANEPTDKKYHSNQIQCKHIDFILCDKMTLEPVLALELDDSSHAHYDRQASDEVKNRVCEQAGLPLMRVKVQYTYPVQAIEEEILTKIRGVTANL